MPTIRDLVAAIRERDGVEAAIVLGRDGLLIDSQADASFDAEQTAAHVPSVLAACDELAAATANGVLTTAVLEHEAGTTVLSVLSREAILVVVVRADAALAPLLRELRRNREHLAALV